MQPKNNIHPSAGNSFIYISPVAGIPGSYPRCSCKPCSSFITYYRYSTRQCRRNHAKNYYTAQRFISWRDVCINADWLTHLHKLQTPDASGTGGENGPVQPSHTQSKLQIVGTITGGQPGQHASGAGGSGI